MSQGLSPGVNLLLAVVILAALLSVAISADETYVETDSATAHLERMTKISRFRFSMDELTATLCSTAIASAQGPHADSAILVYVNDRLVDQIKSNFDAQNLPVGTVLVKEKYADLNTETPQMATIMRRTGDDGVISDWEFSAISLPDGRVAGMSANEKAACADCHANFKKRGFVSWYTAGLLATIADEARDKASAASPDAE